MRIMRRLMQGIQRKTVDALSLDRMSEKYHVLIVNYIFLMLYVTLESVFVNTLLYTIRPDISIVILYRAIVHITAAATMHIAACLCQKKNPIVVVRIGAALYLAMYVALFFGLNHMNLFMIPVALLSGSGSAFYWSGHNVLIPNYTTKTNRDIGISILTIVQGTMTLLVPVVSGYVISLMPGTNGYRVMFGVGMAAVAAQIWVQTKMYPVEQKKHVSQIRLAFKLVRKKASVKLMLCYEILRGFRDGSFAFIMNMILFEIITNESLVGLNTFFTGAASIIGAWVYGRLVRPDMRARVVFLSAAVLLVACIPLFFIMNMATVMLYSVINAFIALFIVNSCCNSSFDVLSQNETMRGCMGEIGAFREGALCIGRVSGMLVVLLFPHNQQGYVSAILVLTGAQFFCSLLLRRTREMLDRKKGLVHEPGFEPPGHTAGPGSGGD